MSAMAVLVVGLFIGTIGGVALGWAACSERTIRFLRQEIEFLKGVGK